jgi:tRNA-guanine family transglycosylase
MKFQRFGNAIVDAGTLNLRHQKYANDFSPIDENCECVCCRPTDKGGLGVTKAYIHHVTAKETVGAHL